MGSALALEGASERLGGAADRLKKLRGEELAARTGFDVTLRTLVPLTVERGRPTLSAGL
jgi:hypothetical protein